MKEHQYIQFKPGQKNAPKDAEISYTHESFPDCGYLIPDDELIIDIDNIPKTTIKQIIHIFQINTQVVWTDRGAHLYFKKADVPFGSKTGICALGIPIEIKDSKNTPRGITIKRNGILREIENLDKRQEVPDIFQIRKGSKRFMNMLEIEDGTRNKSLYQHRLKLDKHKQCERILHFINQFIFPEPLPDKEIETLGRDMEVSEKTGTHETYAQEIIEQYRIVNYNGSFYLNENGKWVNDGEAIKRICQKHLFGKGYENHYFEGLTRYIKSALKVEDFKGAPISLKNGFLKDGKFYPVRYTTFTPYHIDIEYIPGFRHQPVTDYLDFMSSEDKETVNTLMDMIACCLITDPDVIKDIGKIFMIRGRGGNGKGTLLNIIRSLLGKENCSALDIDQFADPRNLPAMVGKLANLNDDAKDAPIDQHKMKIVKNTTTADVIEIRPMRSNPINVQLTCTLINTTNHTIKSFEKDESFKRRIIWIHIPRKVEKPIKNFQKIITSEDSLKAFLSLVVDAYQVLYETREIRQSESVKQETERYNMENDNLIEFFQSYEKDTFYEMSAKDAYDLYERYCDVNLLNPQSRKMFTQSLKDTYDLKMVKVNPHGVQMWVYAPLDDPRKGR